jgi:hypothetical protein
MPEFRAVAGHLDIPAEHRQLDQKNFDWPIQAPVANIDHLRCLPVWGDVLRSLDKSKALIDRFREDDEIAGHSVKPVPEISHSHSLAEGYVIPLRILRACA